MSTVAKFPYLTDISTGFPFLSEDYLIETASSVEQVSNISRLTKDVVAAVGMALPPLKRKRVAEVGRQKRPLFSAIS